MGIQVTDLRVEAQVNPIGLDIRRPRLGWKIQSDRRNVRQTAYRIIAADSPDRLDNMTGLLWDTGRVESDQSTFVPCDGPPLESRQRCWWKVMVWDEQGNASAWSDAGSWEMGLLEKSDWKAKWIEPKQLPVVRDPDLGLIEALKCGGETDTGKLHPCPLLRRTFRVVKPLRKARVYATAHGVYSLELNGRKAGDYELAPGFTSYDKLLFYQTYDVTEWLVPGRNAIGVVLGDGWYAGRIGLVGTSCQYGDRLGLLLQLELEYEDGTRDLIVSDEKFVSSTGQWVYSDLFIGEKVDARLAKDGWSKPDYDDSGWEPVKIADYGYDVLAAQYGEPVRVIRELPALSVIHTPAGDTVIDFGQVIVGRVRMSVRGEAGTVVTLEHSEVLDENGNFIHNIMGRHKDQKDVYILKGGGEESFEPLFAFHGFRYVRVTGYPGTVRPEAFTALVLCSDLDCTGSFRCSDERLNRLQENIVRSQTGNMISIPTDCPQRERAGWTGDIQIFAPTATFNMNMYAFLGRWMRNLALEQAVSGEVPIVVPYHDSMRKAQAGLGRRMSSAGWSDAVTIVPWALYQAYGDRGILEEFYESMKKWVGYIEHCASTELPADVGPLDGQRRERQRYLWNTGFHFGDWLLPSLTSGHGNPIASALATKELAATCFFAHSADLLAAIAAELGKESDAAVYSELAGKIREAFTKEYLLEDGRLPAHYQGIYVLALAFRMVPDAMRPKVFGQLVGLIEQNGYRLDTGFVSVPYLLDVLCDNGRVDLAYRILYQREAPSWLYAVDRGATTIWEAWDAIKPDGTVTRMSYNHYAFGCVGDWMYRRIGGIRRLLPGYKKIGIRPGLESGLQYAQTEYESVYGTIRSEWKLTDQGYALSVSIPPNTSAVVVLPDAGLNDVSESGVDLAQAVGIHVCREAEGEVRVETGSGHYHFEVRSTRYRRLV